MISRVWQNQKKQESSCQRSVCDTAGAKGPQNTDCKATADQQPVPDTVTSFFLWHNFFQTEEFCFVTILRFARTIKLTIKVSKPGSLIKTGVTTIKKRIRYLTINSLLWEAEPLFQMYFRLKLWSLCIIVSWDFFCTNFLGQQSSGKSPPC